MVPLTVKELNSTGKKHTKPGGAGVGIVRPSGALNRDLSMPRLRMHKEKPIDEYIPNALPRV